MGELIPLEKRRKKTGKPDKEEEKSARANVYGLASPPSSPERFLRFMAVVKAIRSRTLTPETVQTAAIQLANAFIPPITDTETELSVFHVANADYPYPNSKADPIMFFADIAIGLREKALTRGDAAEIIRIMRIWYPVVPDAPKTGD